MMKPLSDDVDDELGGSGATDEELDGSEARLLEDELRQEHIPPHVKKGPHGSSTASPGHNVPLPLSAAAKGGPRPWYWPRPAPYLLLLVSGALYIGGRQYLISTHGSKTTTTTTDGVTPSTLAPSSTSALVNALGVIEGYNTSSSPVIQPAPSSSSFPTTLHHISPSKISSLNETSVIPPPFSPPFIPTEIPDAVRVAAGPPSSSSSSSSLPHENSSSTSASSSLPTALSSSPFSSSVPSPHRLSSATSSSLSSSSSLPLPSIPPPSTPLDVQASTDEYGTFAEETLRLYGWDLILEANRAITLQVLNRSPTQSMPATSSLASSSSSSSDNRTDASPNLPTYDWYVEQHDGTILLSLSAVGPVVKDLYCTQPGTGLSIYVTEYPSFRTFSTTAAACKNVRREMRALTREDRQMYLKSLNTFYRVPLAEGRKRFGPRFANNPLLTSAHNSQTWCLHGPNQFLAVHSAFVYWGEQNMKRSSYVDSLREGGGGAGWGEEDVNQLSSEAGPAAGAQPMSGKGSPSLGAIPYWDFHIDTHEYGPQWWWRNPFFQDDDDEGFGPIDTSPAVGHVVEGSGRFARMPMVRGDQLPKEVHDAYDPAVDDFGLVTGSPFTLNSSPFVTRSGTVCGLPMALPMAPAQNLFDCYDNFDTWREATTCMYMQVHLQLHSYLGGGAWNCGVDLESFHSAYPQFPPELLSFLGVSGRHVWSTLKTKRTRGLISYRECEIQAGRCSCPNLDAERMPYPKLYRLLVSALRRASRTWPGEFFVGPYRDTEELRFKKKDGTFFEWEDQERLLRMVARLWCEGAVDGHFVSMASINDPVFYAAHVYFDRLSHFLALSPAFAERGFNRTWNFDVEEDGARRQEAEVGGKDMKQQGDPWEKDEYKETERRVDGWREGRPRKLRGGNRLRDERQQEEPPSDNHHQDDGETEMARSENDYTEHIHHRITREECLGGQYQDSSPFTPFLLMSADEEKRLRDIPDEKYGDSDPHRNYIMSDLDALMHPLHPSLPYVYDDLVHWGGNTWIPRGE